MKLNTIIAAVVLALGYNFATAQDTPASSDPAAVAAQSERPSPVPAMSADNSTSKVVPNIVIHWDCGSCEENAKVAPLIEKTYKAEALAKGHTVSATETAQVTIKEYRQRHPATRSLFGAFAGKDKLATKLTFRGKDYDAGDYSANAFQGMNSLCESVARQALTQVLAAL